MTGRRTLREVGDRSHKLAHAILDRARAGEPIAEATITRALVTLGDL